MNCFDPTCLVWSSHCDEHGLQGAKLSNANLKGANLQRAYLRHVNLRDTVSIWSSFSVQLSKTFTQHHGCLLSKTSGLHASSMQIKSKDLSVFILFSDTLLEFVTWFLFVFFSRFDLSALRRCKARWSQLALVRSGLDGASLF